MSFAMRVSSYLEATARERITRVFDAGSFEELLPPAKRIVSPHLAQLDAPVSFDDGVVIGHAALHGAKVCVAAQEGGFMGGAVGEVHGAKLVGLCKRAVQERVEGVILLLETGGVRLHEANAGLIAVSEVMRAVLDTRSAGIAVIALVGGANGCFGGMGIVARCANAIIMSEEGRLAMSGPEVIETANGVEEFDARDRALVWRTTGGKHRYLLGDCQDMVADDVKAFRRAASQVLQECKGQPTALNLPALAAEHAMLEQRTARFGDAADALEIWQRLGMAAAQDIPLLEAELFVELAQAHRVKGVA